MDNRLDRLLDSIAPYRTLDGVGRVVDEALNAFPLQAATVQSATELRDILERAWRHLHGRLWGTRQTLPVINRDLEWHECQLMLNAVYGSAQGWRTALELARTGVDGGLRGVLDAFFHKAAEQYLDRIIDAGIQSLWRGLSYEQQLAVIEEYIRRYRGLLPVGLINGSRTDLLLSFPRLLREYPRIVQRASWIGRS